MCGFSPFKMSCHCVLNLCFSSNLTAFFFGCPALCHHVPPFIIY
uniref:Uncharacterized protein n=2 Tax=Anguilla anguilla TaxID=7936 RepID=A0A0E9Q1L2_ANGAN